MKHAHFLPLVFLLAACAAKPKAVSPEAKAAPVWRYAVRADAQGKRHAFAVDMNSPAEIALPDGLWCPHGALIELQRDAQGKVVGAESRAEPARVMPGGKNLPAFVLAPAESQREPWVVLRCQVNADQADWAVWERVNDRLTRFGPWQIEHLQFQRMERPGPGLDNCVLLTFQAGEGSQHAVVKVEVGGKGAKLRPRTEQDAAILRHFLGRATPAEKAVVEKVLGE